MHSFAHPAPWALLGIIVASALGALVMCLLVLAVGLPAEPKTQPGRSTRRLLLTRVAYALGAACFAIAAMLAVVALVRSARERLPIHEAAAVGAGLEALGQRVEALEARVERDATRTRETEEGVEATASRLTRADSRLNHLETGVQATSSRLDRIDARVSAAEGALRQAATDAAHALAVAKQLGERPVARVPARLARAAAKPAQPDASAPAKSPPTERSLGDKLHDDWQTIKREGEASPGEIKKAFGDLWEQLTR